MKAIDSEDVFMTVKDREDAEQLLGVPVVEHIPMIEHQGLRLIRDISSFSPLMECFRSLRTNIRFLSEQRVRTLTITSSVPAEGKSTTLANLAMASAMMIERNRIVVVDADLRRPSQHKIFKTELSPGLADILKGTHTIEQVIRPTSVPNVMVIPAGSPPTNPAELLDSDAMGRFLSDLETISDLALFDTPPTLAVVDSSIVASRTEGVLLIIGNGETKKISVAKTLQVLARAKANVIGTVFNRLSGQSIGYYYGKYYVPSEPEPKDTAPGTEAEDADATGVRAGDPVFTDWTKSPAVHDRQGLRHDGMRMR